MHALSMDIAKFYTHATSVVGIHVLNVLNLAENLE